MADLELELLAKIIDDADLRTAIDCGIQAHVFRNKDARSLFKYIFDYYHDQETAGNVPTRELVDRAYRKQISLPRPSRLDLRALCAEVLKDSLKEQLAELGESLCSLPVDDALEILRTKANELTTMRRAGRDLDMASSADAIIEDYENIKTMRGCLGVPYPWPTLNQETKGMMDGEFIVFYGRPKSMKTWCLLYIAAHAYEKANRKVLVYTREMTPVQMRNRLLSIFMGVPYTYFRDARLNELQLESGRTYEDLFYDLVSTMKDDEDTTFGETGKRKQLIITNDREIGIGGSIAGLEAKVQEYMPDLICVDGAYLLHRDGKSLGGSSRWEDMTYITHALKTISMKYNRPVVCTTQANRKGEEEGRIGSVSDIAFSDSFGQDCDLAIKVVKTPKDKDHNEIAMLIAAAREANAEGFAIHGNAATNFDQIYRKARNADGTLKVDPESGDCLLEPVIFYSKKDIREFLKEDNRANQERELIAGFAAASLRGRK